MSKLKALIFDVDGTLADTESAHRNAFNAAFAEACLGWYWNESLYAQLLVVTGGKERILHYWKMTDPEEAGGRMAPQIVDEVHRIKTRHYDAMVRGGRLGLRPGILRLIGEAQAAGIPIAIASTTSASNIDALLQAPLGSRWRSLFAAVCDASSVAVKKPAPDVYLAALDALDLRGDECLAFEDSENGLRAAHSAGIPTLVTPTAYTAGHRFDDALLVLPYLGDPDHRLPQHVPGADQHWVDLAALHRWHHGIVCKPA